MVLSSTRKTFQSAFLRARLKFQAEGLLGKSGKPSTIGFMSRVRGEGVSSVVANLAAVMYQQDPQQLVVVDGNPFDKSLAATFHKEQPGLQLDEVTVGAQSVFDADLNAKANADALRLVEADMDGLQNEQLWEEQMNRLKSTYRNVFVDIGSWDTESPLFWLERVDHVVLVIDGQSTTREILTHFSKNLDSCGCKLSGFLLNQHERPVPEFIYRMMN